MATLDLGALRQSPPSVAPAPDAQDIEFNEILPDKAKPSVQIELPDGSVSVSFGRALSAASLHDVAFDENLAESLSDSELGTIAEDLLEGIEEDQRSRQEWLDERAEGIKLLALKIEKPTSSTSGMGAGVDNTSRSRSTLILEAALRFQANASGELLPADGPLKVQDKLSSDTLEGDELAQLLEDDLNYYLTEIASEYEPDTERMLFWTGFGGAGFKKVYRCPIRQRPVSESVDAADLIVSNNATDLKNADRITLVTQMRQSVMRRMQFLKVYRQVELGQPTIEIKTAVEDEKESVTGITVSQRPQDTPFTIYECYCNIDVPGDEHKVDGEISGLPRPYKVSIDKTSRTVLEIRRNWKKDDSLEQPKEVFVKFPYVPALGFYEIGLVQIAGNPTTAATALLRVMIDSGIFGNFPGGVVAKTAAKQNTMDVSVAPGSFFPLDTSMIADGDIRKAVMPLPYKEAGPGALQLFNEITQAGQHVAGTAEIAVGEGRQDAPVGTTIALIEQAVKIMNAVHKRLHKAQAKEFKLLRDLFCEYPEDFIKFNDRRNVPWDRDKLLKALNDYDLVPRADPNTASQVQRIMRAQALYQMAKADPQLFQINAVLEYVIRVLGINNPQSFTQVPQQGPQQQPDPKAQASLVSAQAQQTKAAADLADVQLRAKNLAVDNANKDADRSADERIASMKLRTEEVIHDRDAIADILTQQRQHAHERDMKAQDIANASATEPAAPT